MNDPFRELNERLASVEGFVDVWRPLIKAMVNDGFTDREARMIIAGCFGPRNDPDNKPPEDKPDA
jgi:hypothetical protein